MQKVKAFFSTLSSIIKYLTEHFKGILLAIFIIYLILPSGDVSHPANLVRIDLVGQIRDSSQIIEKIEQAGKDKKIKGVLLVISSPGGAVAPSIEIAHAVKRLAQIKPVVSYAQGSIASGSYYASIWSTKIIANPGSIVGSIGVIFAGMNLENMMQKLGISTQIIKAGRYKESGTVTRAWHTYEKKELQKVISNIYKLFISDVAQARGLKIKDEKTFADAHIFTASEAKKVGLIDTVATIFEAKQTLKRLSNVKEAVWQTPSIIEKFGEQLSSKIITTIDTQLLQPVLK
jgi:protease-4